jgi:hypothetical protein
LGNTNLRTTSKNLRTASPQIFKLLPFLIHIFIFHLYIHEFDFFFLSLFLFLSVNNTQYKIEIEFLMTGGAQTSNSFNF